ncbi:MAG: hypothetical protein JWQ79_3182 [Mucilaginibacter sp.]|nr:hypothetical protein [Mucilaginibacter sp.]
MNSISIKKRLWEDFSLPFSGQRLKIQISSPKEIDAGVMDDDNLQTFYSSDGDSGIPKLVWFEEFSDIFSFEVDIPNDGKKYSLVIWNAYENDTIYVTYNVEVITPLYA